MTGDPAPLTLAAVIKKAAEYEREARAWPETARIALLRDCSVEQLVPYLKLACFSAGIHPDIRLGGFDSIQDELLNRESPVRQDPPDVVVVAMHAPQGESIAREGLERRSQKTRSILDSVENLLGESPALVILTTLVEPTTEWDGLARAAEAGGERRGWAGVNDAIRTFAGRHAGRVFLCDLDRLVRHVGVAHALDRRSEMKFGAPYRPDFLQTYANELMRVVLPLKGRARKCVVVDCDNTLWGGIVGEDGLQGIALDPSSYPGCAYWQFHQALLRLAERGILLALCSKNEEADVFEVLERHPHSLLRRSHLAAWRVNWERKSVNLLALARELSLGVESLVFVDDNAAELEEVRRHVPGLATVQVPTGELHRLPELLFGFPELEQLSVSREDAQRTQYFHDQREREELRAGFSDDLGYLQALEIRAVIHPASPAEVARVAQLTQKTNQFNLTTRRYSEAQIQAMLDSADHAVYTLTAKDKYGDYGLTGVLIAQRGADAGRIDTLLLSCRVLARRLEIALVREALTELAARWNLSAWQAHYLPTKKNAQVVDFWQRAGFQLATATDEGREYYRADVTAGWEDSSFITVTHE